MRGYRSVWSCVALAAVVCNALASAFCCTPSSSRKTIVDPVLGGIPICTSALGTADSGSKQSKGSKQHCPVCLAAANKALVSNAVAWPLDHSAFVTVGTARVDAPALAERLKLGGLGSRAPPLHA